MASCALPLAATNRRGATFRAEQVDDRLWEQFAWLSLAFRVSTGLAAWAWGTGRFGGVVSPEPEPSDRANHHDREPFGTTVLPEPDNRRSRTQEQQEQA
ncbi:hypothetical protein [Paenibacillus sp. MBLB4367]|uniref:hypothetical protein n=1 Tax=Paenibacillus sp. MBLB4367 TaxID=3384767 RepID=UPI003908108B